MAYTVREVEEEDLDKGLFEALENLKPVGDISLEKAKEIFHKIRAQNGHMFVAIEEGEVIGSTTILIEQKFINNGGVVGHIEDVATRKGHERKGVGRALMEKAIEKARKEGCYKVILDCSDNNVPFYEKLDFYKDMNCMRIDL